VFPLHVIALSIACSVVALLKSHECDIPYSFVLE
jgi:hypothetical protein